MDIIAAIDAVTGCQYPPCGRQLDDSSPSPDFCSPQHQAAWSDTRAVPLERDDEPLELAAHVFNAAEFHHPETCVACTEGRWCPDRSASADSMMLRPGDVRSVVAAMRRAMPHSGHHLEVSATLGPEQSPAEHRVLTEWEQQLVDGMPDYTWTPYDGRASGAARPALDAILLAIDARSERLASAEEARDRALEARRNRNTGPPSPKRRAPRNLPPRRSR